VRVRWRHERGEMGSSSSAFVLLVVGISIWGGLRVSAPVDTDEAAMVCCGMVGKSVVTVQQ